MSIHTRLVGAFDGLILSLTAAVNIVVLTALLNPSLALSEIMSRRGTVMIQQIAMDDVATAIRYV
jgi:hypothetical protein